MNWGKLIGGVFFALGLLMGACVILSYLDGYPEWWHFIIYSSVNTIGGFTIWKRSS